jgi:hypothetical protein
MGTAIVAGILNINMTLQKQCNNIYLDQQQCILHGIKYPGKGRNSTFRGISLKTEIYSGD